VSTPVESEQRTLILHGGMHKTGSSAIQEYLFRHLEEPGVEYFCFDRPNSSLILLEAFHSCLESLPRYRDMGLTDEDLSAKRAKARRRFQRHLAACRKQTLIISAESFSLLDLADCQDLAEQLRTYYSRIKLVLYVRPLRSRIESAFQQKLKQRWIPLEDKVVINFRKQISNYDAVFGRENVDIRPFHPDIFPGHSVVNDFLQACKLPPAGHFSPRVNVGLSLPAVQLLYIYRLQYSQAGSEDKALLARLSELPGERFRMHRDLVQKVLIERDDSYAWLEERAGVSLEDDSGRDGVEVASESDLLRLEASTLQWLEEQTAGLVTASGQPGPEAIAAALKTWAMCLQGPGESS